VECPKCQQEEGIRLGNCIACIAVEHTCEKKVEKVWTRGVKFIQKETIWSERAEIE
jgi:hypothetical protein